MPLFVECIPSAGTAPVAPCGTLNGVHYEPVMRAVEGGTLDYSGLGQLFVWALGFVLIAFAAGVGLGAIMRVIRSA